MPAINGATIINSVDGGTVNFGDAFYISPKSSSKTNSGSGGFNTGSFINTNNVVSVTGTNDPDASDQPTVANA